MKLLVDATPLRAGGGVQVAIAFLEGLARRDDVDWRAVLPEPMLARLPTDLGAAAASRLVAVPKRSKLDLLRAARRLRRIERSWRPDVVFTVFGPAYFRARAPHLVGFALPNLIYERDGPLATTGLGTRIGDAVRRHLFRRADHLVVETAAARRRLADLLAIADDRIAVIGNSVNPVLARYAPAEAPSTGRTAVLTPSTYYRHKNLEVVPEVAAALARSHPHLDIEFRLTLPPDDAAWTRIAGRAEALGVGARVRTLGALSLDELARAYREASCVFLPTLREVSTAVYPEAFYFRRPLVTSDMDFAREACGAAAVYVPPLDPQIIAARLAELVENPDRVARLVAAGEHQLASGYPTTQEKFAAQLALVRSLVPASAGGSRREDFGD